MIYNLHISQLSKVKFTKKQEELTYSACENSSSHMSQIYQTVFIASLLHV